MKDSKLKKKRSAVSGSALARIIIWSAVLCILTGVFIVGMSGGVLYIDWAGVPVISFGEYRYDDRGYEVGNGSSAQKITDLSVEWGAGSVTIIPAEGDEVVITEDYSGEDEKLRLRWKIEEGELSVKFSAPRFRRSARMDELTKDLTIAIPTAMLEAMDEVDIDGVDCNVSYAGNADELSLEIVNGDLTVNGDIGELEVEAVNGSVVFRGGVRRADVTCVNATVKMYPDMAAELSFELLNGDVWVYLSEEITGFSATRDALGGRIETVGFENVQRGENTAHWGDKSLRVTLDSLNAQLHIEKVTKD